MTAELRAKLEGFAASAGVTTKGWLSVVLVVTQHARQQLPLDPEKLKTSGEGQVLGLGMTQVQAILAKHGERRVLAKEGGRTSRGSVGNMRLYVKFLNDLGALSSADLDEIELFWVERVRAFFAGKPFKLRFDRASGLRAVVRDLLSEAEKRQREGSGTQYVGAVAQHLVGAKLRVLLGVSAVPAASFSTADEQGGRAGDFHIADAVIHVTSTPSNALIQKCIDNLANGLRPIIVTLRQRIAAAESLAEDAGAGGRIDIFDIEQFIAANLYERGRFSLSDAAKELARLLDAYNALIDEVETDPSLKIQNA